MDKRERQEALLQAIIQEYIQTARPVGSHTLVNEYGFDYSSATIRNDMAALERAGLIEQPHTSAGRIPTEKGYQYYIHHFLQQKELGQAKKRTIHDVVAKQNSAHHERLKQLARTVSKMTDEAVVISLDSGDTYYTGMSHMLRKPEFAEAAMMLAVSEAFEQIDEIMNELHKKISTQVEIFMGKENPFSQECAVILTEYDLGDEQTGYFGILGPMRMDYETNISIVEYVDSLMNDNHEQRQ